MAFFYRNLSKFMAGQAEAALAKPDGIVAMKHGTALERNRHFFLPLYITYIKGPRDRAAFARKAHRLRINGLMLDDYVADTTPTTERAHALLPKDIHTARLRRLWRAQWLWTNRLWLPVEEQNYDPFHSISGTVR
eukprot:Selendium_serpulae@DN5613_c0_g1_i12.p1